LAGATVFEVSDEILKVVEPMILPVKVARAARPAGRRPGVL
jgi:hypothetical protein